MSTPDWYREEVAAHGARVLAGTETQDEAAAAIAGLLAGHPELLASIAAKSVGTWTRKHQDRDLFHAALFPLIPASLDVAPGSPARVADMTAEDLDKAKVMLMTRTRNVARAARAQQKAFTDFYNKVRPHMSAGRTVSDAIAALAAQEAA